MYGDVHGIPMELGDAKCATEVSHSCTDKKIEQTVLLFADVFIQLDHQEIREF